MVELCHFLIFKVFKEFIVKFKSDLDRFVCLFFLIAK